MRTFFRNKNYVEIETPSKIPVVRAMEQPDLMNGVIDRGKYGMHDTRWPLPLMIVSFSSRKRAYGKGL